MKKKKLIRAVALALAVLLIASPAASASDALGSEVHSGTTHLAQGLDYTRQYLWSASYSDLRTENYLVYTPNTLVQPTVAYGEYILTRTTLTGMAQALEAQGMRVLAGINGDFYDPTGAPLGLVVTDGVLRSSSSYVYALGFDADGNAFIGKPDLHVTAEFKDNVWTVAGGVNKVRDENTGYVLYTGDYNANTYHSSPGVDVILAPSGRYTGLAVGESVTCTVEQVLQSDDSIEIPEDRLVLSVNNNSDPQLVEALNTLQPEDTVEISITAADPQWETAVTAIGGLYKLVTDGEVESGLDNVQAPRTAVGIRDNGSVVFYTIDGRQSGHSVGASLPQVARRLVELGCKEALALDGGGSTSFGTTQPGQERFSVRNKPSDGSQRAVTNALFLVTTQAGGPADRLALTPGDAMVLSGSRLELSTVGVDTVGQTIGTAVTPTLTVSGGGTVSGSTFTAGTQAGTFTLTAQAGGLTGSARITVVPAPDQITVRNEATNAVLSSISLEPGARIDLTAHAVYRNLLLTCSDEAFTWTTAGDLGTISSDGTFVSNGRMGSGSVTVSAGGKSVTVPLSVVGHIYTVETFEGSLEHITGGSASRVDPETRASYIRFGDQSARVTYNTAIEAEDAAVDLSLDLRPGEKYLSLWVYGDGSGNTLTASVLAADDQITETPLATLNFTGWRQLVVSLPDGAVQLLSLKIAPTGKQTAGIFWLDQITTSNQSAADTTPPTVTAARSGDTLTAVLSDNVDQSFTAGQISVTLDGRPLSNFTLNGTTVTAVLSSGDGKAHRVTVTVTDASGNIGRASVDVAADEEHKTAFADTDGHWAVSYIDYLYDQGVVNGDASGGTPLFRPNSNITRGDFALMLARWLGLDLTKYSGVQLPFADTASIPAWSLDAVKAMYALGVMQGSDGADGRLYANANNSITRAEAMTLLGRVQTKGYVTAGLTFADTASVPAWAADYVATLVAQGVVGGYPDNTIAPNAPITRGETAKLLYTMW